MIKIQFLGTSAGAPSTQRNVTGLAITPLDKKPWYLVDCGEATQHQILHTSLSLARLSAIFITHVHGDHIFGLPGLIASASLSGRVETLRIYAPEGVQHFVETALSCSESFSRFPLEFITVNESSGLLDVADFKVQVCALSHRVPCFAYRFDLIRPRKIDQQKLIARGIEKGPLWGELQREGKARSPSGDIVHFDEVCVTPEALAFVVGGDNDKPSLLEHACQNANLLIHESTYTQEVASRVGPGPQHSSAKQVATFAQSVQLPHLILTHFSTRYHASHNHEGEKIIKSEKKLGASKAANTGKMAELEGEAKEFYSGDLHMAKDFDQFILSDEGLKIVDV